MGTGKEILYFILKNFSSLSIEEKYLKTKRF